MNRLLFYRKPTIGQYLRTATTNPDLVSAGGYAAISTAAATKGVTTAGYYWLNNAHVSRIRQHGSIEVVQLYAETLTDIAEVWAYVWRKNGATWDLVGREEIMARMTAGQISTVTLTTPIAVQPGDYFGYGATASAGTVTLFTHISGGAAATYRLVTTPPTGSTNWAAGSDSTIYGPVIGKMRPPVVVGIGDSITAGHNGNYSFIESTQTTDSTFEYLAYLRTATGCTYQNMGIGSQTSTQIAARFAADVVALKPKMAIIECGFNDIALSATQATFIANMTTMLDLCRTNSIIPVFVALPWTNATDEQSATYETWLTALRQILPTYPFGTFADLRPTLGEGTNYRNIKTAYDSDGAHYNATGYQAMATALCQVRIGAK